MEKSQIINELLKRNYLVSPNMLSLSELELSNILSKLDQISSKESSSVVVNKDTFIPLGISSVSFNKQNVVIEKENEHPGYLSYIKKVDQTSENRRTESLDFIKPSVKVLSKILKNEKKIELKDFVEYFKIRYKTIREMLQKRPELQEVISISKVLNKKDKDIVSIIGILVSKSITKNDNFILEIEDLTGIIKLIVGKKDLEIYNACKELTLDEVLGVIGNFSKGIIFPKRVIFPDVPLTKELKKSPDETYLICTSDIHVGSRLFHRDAFLNFIGWLNGNYGDEKQVEISKKVKYILVTGDLVAGVGVYPNQDKDLTLKDINEQYKELANLLSRIRKDILIVLIPGDHDAVMVNEPQPILDKEFAKEIFELENIILVTNPSLINIHSSENFEGFNCLLYHGHSFIYYADNIDSIRSAGWTARGDLIMKYLLQRRHLAPTHSSTTYLPETSFDPLVIDIVPDFLISGHLHQVSNLLYRNVSLVGCGCWEALTPYQEKTGNKADPAKVSLINLKTRELKILNFLQESFKPF